MQHSTHTHTHTHIKTKRAALGDFTGYRGLYAARRGCCRKAVLSRPMRIRPQQLGWAVRNTAIKHRTLALQQSYLGLPASPTRHLCNVLLGKVKRPLPQHTTSPAAAQAALTCRESPPSCKIVLATPVKSALSYLGPVALMRYNMSTKRAIPGTSTQRSISIHPRAPVRLGLVRRRLGGIPEGLAAPGPAM